MHAIGERLLTLLICTFIGLIIFSFLRHASNASPTDIQQTTLYTIVEFNGHTYLENFRSDAIVHNPDCTNSKCFKE